MLSESYLVDENDLCCSTVTRLRWWVGACSVPSTEGSRKVSHRGVFGEDGGDDGGRRERPGLQE